MRVYKPGQVWVRRVPKGKRVIRILDVIKDVGIKVEVLNVDGTNSWREVGEVFIVRDLHSEYKLKISYNLPAWW